MPKHAYKRKLVNSGIKIIFKKWWLVWSLKWKTQAQKMQENDLICQSEMWACSSQLISRWYIKNRKPGVNTIGKLPQKSET